MESKRIEPQLLLESFAPKEALHCTKMADAKNLVIKCSTGNIYFPLKFSLANFFF